VLQAPYCNAFQPPRGSGLPPILPEAPDQVRPAVDSSVAFECKYELDSLASFLSLSFQYFSVTGDQSFMTPGWLGAVNTVLEVIDAESRGAFDEAGQYQAPRYTFQRQTDVATETLALAGAGNPANGNTSLVRSAFRPSDDATIFPFLIPANAYMAVELGHLATLLSRGGQPELAQRAAQRGQTLEAAVWRYGVVDHALYGPVFAYEVDGYGSHLMMDDANLPSLLSLPKVGFVAADNPVYANTRRMVLDGRGNPYYLRGVAASGIGGPHVGPLHAWPMSSLVRIQTSDDDAEIVTALELVKRSTAGLGLMHEGVNVRVANDYTRSWFAWANTLFGETLLDLARRKPHLIFGEGAAPYVPGEP
jgi:meiotically up-regulated gene 157 (Mug157) protein